MQLRVCLHYVPKPCTRTVLYNAIDSLAAFHNGSGPLETKSGGDFSKEKIWWGRSWVDIWNFLPIIYSVHVTQLLCLRKLAQKYNTHYKVNIAKVFITPFLSVYFGEHVPSACFKYADYLYPQKSN